MNAELMANISLNTYRLPTAEDFSGAVTAIQRLQATYQLSTSNFSSGRVGKDHSLAMTGRGVSTSVCARACKEV